jgi:hypothetical protein
MQRLHCDRCRESLVSEDLFKSFTRPTCHLLTLKNQGGLVRPSEGVVRICEATERVIRQKTCTNKANNDLKSAVMVSRVLAIVGSKDILNLNDHILDTQDGIENHHYSLLRNIASRYIALRHHHLAKLATQHMHGSFDLIPNN